MNATEQKFAFDGRKLTQTSRHTTREISVQDWNEIGVEVIHEDSSRSNFCLVINRPTHNLRVPNDAPVFKALLDYFPSLEGFDWQPLVKSSPNPAFAYSLCWRRTTPEAGALSAAA